MSRLADLERHHAAVAVVALGGAVTTYRELAAYADSLAAGFPTGRGLGVILCRNDLGTLAAYLAALRHDQVALLVDANLSTEKVDSLIQAYRAEWRADGGTISVTGQRGAPIDARAAVLLSTSGTTGSPRQVALSSTNLDSNAAAIVAYLEIGPGDRAVTTLPFHYSYDLSVINSHLLAGATLLLTDAAVTTRSFWEFCRQHGATSLAGVPATYEILARLKIECMDLPALRTLTQAGGRLRPDLVRRFASSARERGRRFFVMYGQTEAAPRMAYLPPAFAEEHPDCIGIPIPGGDLRLIGADGQAIAGTGIEGELVYRGQNVMQGYVRCRDDLVSLLPPGELRTGDLAVRTPAGLYRITGRRKRMIKLYGHRFALDELEQALACAGHEVVCGGGDDRLIIAHRPGADRDAIRSFAVQVWRVPAAVLHCVEVESWPTTASGKIAYHALAALI